MADWIQLAKGIDGSEGPMFDQAGRLLVVQPSRGQILEVLRSGQVREVGNTGGVPAGLMVDQANHVWIADMRKGILRMRPDGQIEPMVDQFDGQPMRGCNDLCFDPHGNLFFTAPAGSSADKPVGEVYGRLCDGTVIRIDGGMRFPNGLSVSPSGSRLIVAETFTKQLWAYDLDQQGRVAGQRQAWAKLSGDHRGGPDGIDFDEQGHLLATNWGGGCIEVFDPYGHRVEVISLPFQKPSNLHFGGADGCDLIVTEHDQGGVWKGRWSVPGLLALKKPWQPSQ